MLRWLKTANADVIENSSQEQTEEQMTLPRVVMTADTATNCAATPASPKSMTAMCRYRMLLLKCLRVSMKAPFEYLRVGCSVSCMMLL